MPRLVLLILLSLLSIKGFAIQADSTTARPGIKVRDTYRRPLFADSAARAFWQARKDSIQHVADSLKAIGDSLSMVWLKPPSPERTNRFRDSLIEVHLVKDADFQAWTKKFPKKVERYDTGKPRPKGELWVIAFVFILLLSFAILKNAFSKELAAIVDASYSNRVLAQINKEDKFFNSWPFIFLYLLFGFTIGMFIYQVCLYLELSYDYSGFNWFVRLSLLVILLLTGKIFILRILGFLFDAVRIVKEYVTAIILSYFTAALVFLPIVIAFCLTPARFAPIYIYLSLILLAGIFLVQFFRAATNILTNYRFPLIYLIFYLCALEICPILILIKALRF